MTTPPFPQQPSQTAFAVEADDPGHRALAVVVFPTKLGWMAVRSSAMGVEALSFGHRSPESARMSLHQIAHGGKPALRQRANEPSQTQWRATGENRMPGVSTGTAWGLPPFGVDCLIERLQAFARGAADDFHDVPVDFGQVADFTCRVWTACRTIGYGTVATYAELATRVGSPRAARAVGNAMAANRVPLIIPCHRVIACGGRIGRYSAPGGPLMKRRLLDLEVASRRTGRPAGD